MDGGDQMEDGGGSTMNPDSTMSQRAISSRRMRVRGGGSVKKTAMERKGGDDEKGRFWTNPLTEQNMTSSMGIYNAFKTVSEYLNEALNEAADNDKFLEKLKVFVEPLYNTEQSMDIILESLPLLMANLKMIFTLSRYYR